MFYIFTPIFFRLVYFIYVYIFLYAFMCIVYIHGAHWDQKRVLGEDVRSLRTGFRDYYELSYGFLDLSQGSVQVQQVLLQDDLFLYPLFTFILTDHASSV